MIPPIFIQQLLDRADIVALIGQSVKLKKSGVNYMGLCPFHQEKSPSFSVQPSKQFFHCFGCGAHGTAVGFVMQHRNVGFIEAVEALAEWLGIPMPDTRGQAPRVNYDSLYQCLETTASIFQRALLHADQQSVREYLASRAINADTIARFRIGYAPGHFANRSDALRQALAEAGFQDEALLIRAGLLIARDDGGVIERFRHRLMVPIIDRKGRVIGFGGRTLGKDEPKYLNSPETEVFHKGREWFGLPQAQEAIRKEDVAIVVEGYFDAMALSQAGIHPVVASMGTAMTPEQIGVLWGMCAEMVLCFDGDLAGMKAAWRAIDRLLPLLQDGKTVRIVTLPDGMDPDDCVKKYGADATRQRLMAGRPLSDVLIEELQGQYDGSSEGKAGLVRRAAVWLQAISAERAPIFHRDILQRIARVIDLPVESIIQGIPVDRTQKRANGEYPGRNTHRESPREWRLPTQRKAAQQERWGLMEALAHPECVHEVLAGVINPASRYSQCLQWLADRYDAGELPELWAAKMEWLAAEGFGEVVAELMDMIAREEFQAPQEEDMKFRREHKEVINTRDQNMSRYQALCEKMRREPLSEAEKTEFKNLIPLMRSLQRSDP